MLRKSKTILTLALVLVLCLAGIQTALAEVNSSGAVIGTEAKPAQAAISKVLKVPFGTKVPNATFEFLVTSISMDSQLCDKDHPNMPTIGKVDTNKYPANTGFVDLELGKANNSGEKLMNENTNGTSTWVHETANIFDGVAWQHAGIYRYEITEKGLTYSIADPTMETMTYSTAKYTLDVYVREYTNRPGEFYVYAIAAVITVVDHDGQTGGDKVDPTPGGNEITMTGYSDMTFTNNYWKHNGGTDPKDPNAWTLAVKKIVAGTFGNKETYFDFKMTVTKPSLVPDTPTKTYNAYIVEVDSSGKFTVVTDLTGNKLTASGTDKYDYPFVTFTSGEEKTFSLKDSQYLVFLDTTVGATYKITELASAFYQPSAEVFYNGASIGVETKDKNTTLTIPDVGNTVLNKPLYVGESGNSANFKNTRDDVTPTGLNLNNIPFIAMIALAIAPLVLFVAFKSCKRGSCTKF